MTLPFTVKKDSESRLKRKVGNEADDDSNDDEVSDNDADEPSVKTPPVHRETKKRRVSSASEKKSSASPFSTTPRNKTPKVAPAAPAPLQDATAPVVFHHPAASSDAAPPSAPAPPPFASPPNTPTPPSIPTDITPSNFKNLDVDGLISYLAANDVELDAAEIAIFRKEKINGKLLWLGVNLDFLAAGCLLPRGTAERMLRSIPSA